MTEPQLMEKMSKLENKCKELAHKLHEQNVACSKLVARIENLDAQLDDFRDLRILLRRILARGEKE